MSFRRQMLFVVVAGLVSLILAPSPVAASLSGGDLLGESLAIDSITNLEWLNLEATQGLSWNQAELSTFVTNDGFRHATSDEVNTLFLNAGFLTTNNVNNPLNDPAAALLLTLLGDTLFDGTINATGRGFAEYSPNSAFTVRPNYHNSGLGAGAAIVSLFQSDRDFVDGNAGHFLVRASHVAGIPEPGAFAIWGLLGATVGLVARRQMRPTFA
ncbi:MAG: hypothetical protein ACR2NU_16025 [Aeoliella sp.]